MYPFFLPEMIGAITLLKHGMGSWESLVQTSARPGILSCHLTCLLRTEPAAFASAIDPRWQRKMHRAEG